MESLCSNEAGLRYQKIVTRMLSRYWDHPCFEDLVGYTLLVCLRTVSNLPPERREDADGVVYAVSRKTRKGLFRRSANLYRTFTDDGNRLPRVIPLDELNQRDRELPELRVEDFAPGLNEAFDRQRLWNELYTSSTSKQRIVLYLLFREEWSLARIARHVGIAQQVANQRLTSALNRWRRENGVPERRYGNLNGPQTGAYAEKIKKRRLKKEKEGNLLNLKEN